MLNKRPLIVFTDVDGKYCVLGGNMRLKALNELKYTEIPVIIADEWTEEQKELIRGRTVTDETKKKLSIINTGKKASDKTKEKLSALRLGKKRELTDNWRANIKKANQGKNKGRVLSEETKAKIRESNRLTCLKKHPKDAQ